MSLLFLIGDNMLNTNEKYLKVNFLIQSIEEDIDEMIEKAKSLKQKKII